MKYRLIGLILTVTLVLSATTVSPLRAQIAGTGGPLQVPIVATIGGATLNGQVDVSGFVQSGNEVFALGRLSGTLSSRRGSAAQAVVRQVALPVDLASSEAVNGLCDIVSLRLGPGTFTLLGSTVRMNPVALNIDAQEDATITQLMNSQLTSPLPTTTPPPTTTPNTQTSVIDTQSALLDAQASGLSTQAGTATTPAGLVCSLTGLLRGTGQVEEIVALLNQIVTAVG